LHCPRLATIPSYIIAQSLCLFCLDDVAFTGGCWGGQTDLKGGPSPLTGGGGGGFLNDPDGECGENWHGSGPRGGGGGGGGGEILLWKPHQ